MSPLCSNYHELALYAKDVSVRLPVSQEQCVLRCELCMWGEEIRVMNSACRVVYNHSAVFCMPTRGTENAGLGKS